MQLQSVVQQHLSIQHGVTTTGVSGNAGCTSTTIIVGNTTTTADQTVPPLFYYCTNHHVGMGGSAPTLTQSSGII